MKLAKSLLLGSATAFVAVAGANAADLPSKKAAPATYVKVCDAYGAGFWNIPGTDTCIHVGGAVRSDYGYYNPKDIIDGSSSSFAVKSGKGAINSQAWEARGRIEVDARTPTAYGTVQSVAIIRASRTSGEYNESTSPTYTLTTATTAKAAIISDKSASLTLERAYTRFAGFTFGANKDNFSFMPSYNYEAAHWSSFANGAKQLAYTAVLGGGFSVTAAIQDWNDTGNPKQVSGGANWVPYNNLPNMIGRVDYETKDFAVALRGAYHQAKMVTTEAAPVSYTKGTWAAALGVSVNLPQLGAGDKLWLDGGYADGMAEYTINWASFKSSATKYLTGGVQINPASWYYNDVTGAKGIESIKSWNVALNFLHYWAPQWRSNFTVSGGAWSPSTTIKNLQWTSSLGAGGNTWGATAGIAFLPTKDFEIGLEAAYNRVKQDYRYSDNGTLNTRTDNGVGGRLRVERTF